MNFNNRIIYELVCGPDNIVRRFRSSSSLGTAYGRWLAEQFANNVYCDPYCLYDWWVRYKNRIERGFFFDLARVGNDPTVFGSLVSRHDWRWRSPKRIDILDAERYHIYEIKPIDSRDEGVPQLADYLTSLNATANRVVLSDLYRPALRGTTRVWHGGTWDPSPYPFVVPGQPDEFCMIYAQQDEQVTGLIVYTVACCVKPDDAEAKAMALAPPELVSLPNILQPARPKFERMMRTHLPFVPPDRVYAFLIPVRAYEVAVAGPEAAVRDQMFRRAWDMIIPPAIRLDPTNQRRLLELYALGNALFPLATDAAFVAAGYLRLEDVLPKYKAQLKYGAGLS